MIASFVICNVVLAAKNFSNIPELDNANKAHETDMIRQSTNIRILCRRRGALWLVAH